MARPLPPSLRSTSLAVDGLHTTSPRAPAPPRRPAVDVLRSPFRCDEKSSHQLVSELADLREQRYGSTGDVKKLVMASDLKPEVCQIPSWSDLRQMLAEIRRPPSPRVKASLPRAEQISDQLDELIQQPQEFIRDQKQVTALRKVVLTELQDFTHDLKSSRAASQPVETSQEWIEPSEVEMHYNLFSETIDLNLPQSIGGKSLEFVSKKMCTKQRSKFLSNVVLKSEKRLQSQIQSSTVDSRPAPSVATTDLVPLMLTISILAPSSLDYPSDRYSCHQRLQDILLGYGDPYMEASSHLRPLVDTQVLPMHALDPTIKLDVRNCLIFKLTGGITTLPTTVPKVITDSDQKPLWQFVLYITSLDMPRSYLMKFLKQLASHFSNRVNKFGWVCEIPPQPPPIASSQILRCRSQLESEASCNSIELEMNCLVKSLCKISLYYSDELDCLAWVSDILLQPPPMFQCQISILMKIARAFGLLHLFFPCDTHSITKEQVKLAPDCGLAIEMKIIFIVPSSLVIQFLATFKIIEMNSNVQKDRALFEWALLIDMLDTPNYCCDKLSLFFPTDFIGIQSEDSMIVTDVSTHQVIRKHGKTMNMWAMTLSFYSSALYKETKEIISFFIIDKQVIVHEKYILYLNSLVTTWATCYLKFLSEVLVMCKSTRYITFLLTAMPDLEITLFG